MFKVDLPPESGRWETSEVVSCPTCDQLAKRLAEAEHDRSAGELDRAKAFKELSTIDL